MTDPAVSPHNERRHYSPSATIIESSRLIPWMMLSSILSGLALALSIVLLLMVAEMRREIRFQSLRLDEYRVALMNAKIDPNPHVEGEMR